MIRATTLLLAWVHTPVCARVQGACACSAAPSRQRTPGRDSSGVAPWALGRRHYHTHWQNLRAYTHPYKESGPFNIILRKESGPFNMFLRKESGLFNIILPKESGLFNIFLPKESLFFSALYATSHYYSMPLKNANGPCYLVLYMQSVAIRPVLELCLAFP